jgi:hypothetical protein
MRLRHRINRLAFVAVVLSGLVLTACSSATPATQPTTTSAATSSGVLAAKSSTVDLGNVPFDVQAEGRFDLVNSGRQPVKLLGAPQVKMLEGC